MNNIIIIGAGASGVYLSILLKEKLGVNYHILVLEQSSSSLKKLLATGNGRCNLSNQDMNVQYYQSDNQNLVNKIISSFDLQKEFNDLGLYCHYQGHLLYPKSEQALSVKRVLMNRAEDLGVRFFYEQEVLSIAKKEIFMIQTSQKTYQAVTVIMAMGSEAGKLSGIQSSRYDILKRLDLNIIEPRPSLVQLYTSPVVKQLKGVRVKGKFSLLENNQCVHTEKGELLFTDYGVSGIAIMQISSFIEENHQYQLSIDFFAEEDEKNLHEYIELRRNKGYNHFYDGLLNSKISSYFETLGYSHPDQIVKLLKDYRLDITGVRSFENAQVMKGGLSLLEVDDNLQVKKYPHLYAMGEILNVAGQCGGYNLHFAFASAYHIASALEREFYDQNT